MNWIDKIINAGFEEQGQKRIAELNPNKKDKVNNYRSTDGWFGLTVYHPDMWFTKQGQDKELLMSLNGMLMPINNQFDALLRTRGCKYIQMKVNNKVVFETWTGEVPNEDIVNQFIS